VETERTLKRAALRLESVSIGWMTIEAAVAIAAGLVAHSIALVGFGLDSAIEWFAAAVVIWQLRGGGEEQRKQRAIRLIASTFFLLAAYVATDAAFTLVTRGQTRESVAGIALSAVAVVLMPILAVLKRRVARGLGNDALEEDAVESFCSALSSPGSFSLVSA
jgi:divalent metal cation (Fe/Co/Zn/Cd) transporter